MAFDESIASPRLMLLQKELAAGNVHALENFWREVATQGTPLVESIDNDPDHVLVTFLWQTKEEIKNALAVIVTGGHFDLLDMQLSRLPGADLWHKTHKLRNDVRTIYWMAPNDSLAPLAEAIKAKNFQERIRHWQSDPLNPHPFIVPLDDGDPYSNETHASILKLPQASPQPWVASRPGAPAGQVELHHFHSDILGNERRVWVYTPAGYTANGDAYDLLVLFDGWAYTTIVPTPTILDNLLADKLISPTVAVLIDNVDGKSRSRELSCHAPFAEFLAQELIPWVHQHYHVVSDPARTTIGGSSSGGVAAVFAGLKHPELFGNILSQSGAFWWKPEADVEAEWLPRQFVLTDKLPLRFYLDVGIFESENHPVFPSILLSNRHMRNILQARGYPLHYAEYGGGHDYICWQGTLADGLLALVGLEPARKLKD